MKPDPAAAAGAISPAPRMTHPLLYEINTRCWLQRLSAEAGRTITLGTVPETELDRWSDWGFTHVWLMGVWTTGPRARALAQTEPHQRRVYDQILPGWRPEDVDGSPYAIADYRLATGVGTDAELAEFRRKLRTRSIRLILDFVPNHLGIDHPWLRHSPEFFVQSPEARPGTFLQPTDTGPRWLAHGKDPYFPPWSDTVQVDYRLAASRQAMTRALASVAARCDGVRCDMAMLLLEEVFDRTWRDFPPADGPVAKDGEFWAHAIRTTKAAHPDFEFLAEVYWGLEPRLQALGFDYTYDKELTDKLLARDGAGVQRHLALLPEPQLAAGIRFLENHDESRIASVLSPEEHRAAALLLLGLPGMRLLHEGQLEGARIRTPVQLIRRPLEAPQAGLPAMYHQLLTLVAASAVGKGRAQVITAVGDNNSPSSEVVLVRWQSHPCEIAVVAVNLAPAPRRCRAPLQLGDSPPAAWRITDLINGIAGDHAAADLDCHGLRVVLPAHGVALYHCQAAP